MKPDCCDSYSRIREHDNWGAALTRCLNRAVSIAIAFLWIPLALANPNAVGSEASRGSESDSYSAVLSEWAAALHDKDIDKLVSLYSPEADFLTPGGNRMAGRTAIRTLMVGALRTYDCSIQFVPHKSLVAAGQIVEQGDYTEQMIKNADHTVHQVRGAYAMVLIRNANATWEIAMQMWTETESSST
jgi:uncharacterized protein (TIGR02246 family)